MGRWATPDVSGLRDSRPVKDAQPPNIADQNRRSVWDRSIPWWHAYFVAVMLIGVIVNVFALDFSQGKSIAGFVTAAVLTIAYWTLAAKHVGRQMHVGSFVYLFLLIASTFCFLAFWEDNGSFILFLCFAQVWVVTDRFVRGALAAVGVGIAAFFGFWGAHFAPGEAAGAALTMGISVVFSLAMGAWVTLIISQSQDRAELIQHLEETQEALAAAHRQEGVTAERERLARDIHDTLAQGYISVITQAQAAGARLDRVRQTPDSSTARSDLEQAAQRLELIEQTARENLAEARALVAFAEPEALRQGTLQDALSHVASRFAAETGIRVDTDLSPGATSQEPSRNTDVVLLRIAQEALANVRRHAAASAVQLNYRTDDSVSTVEIVDNGTGFDVTENNPGFGIRGMSARVAEASGTLRVESEAGAGTLVAAVIPHAVSTTTEGD